MGHSLDRQRVPVLLDSISWYYFITSLDTYLQFSVLWEVLFLYVFDLA